MSTANIFLFSVDAVTKKKKERLTVTISHFSSRRQVMTGKKKRNHGEARNAPLRLNVPEGETEHLSQPSP